MKKLSCVEISIKRIFFASTVAPLIISLAAVGVGLLLFFGVPKIISNEDIRPDLGLILFGSLMFFVSLYFSMVVGVLIISLVLKKFGILTRRILFAVTIIASLAFSFAGFDWSAPIEFEYSLLNFLLISSVSAIMAWCLISIWWRLGGAINTN